MLRSKKFVALIVGVVAAIGVRMGVDPALSDEMSKHIVALVVAYIVGQGIADNGKEAAKATKETDNGK